MTTSGCVVSSRARYRCWFLFSVAISDWSPEFSHSVDHSRGISSSCARRLYNLFVETAAGTGAPCLITQQPSAEADDRLPARSLTGSRQPARSGSTFVTTW